jgi:SAM-dependent methyltransferase
MGLTESLPTRAYSGQVRGLASSAREAIGLYRLHGRNVPEHVASFLDQMREIESEVRDAYGFEVTGRRVLDAGAGQLLLHLAYFSQRNAVTGIDLEVVARGADPRSYVRMVRANGAARTLKTLGRKLLGVDARYAREFSRQMGLRRYPSVHALQMNAVDMAFADATFEFVLCSSVLHHIPDPGRAIDEVARVLEPGGVAHLSLHIWTSDTGSLDPRVMRGDETLPKWPHLRPGLSELVIQNAWLNKLRMAEWKALFAERMPGCQFRSDIDDLAHLEPEARRLRASGELAGYALDELLTRRLVVLWRKPRDSRPGTAGS